MGRRPIRCGWCGLRRKKGKGKVCELEAEIGRVQIANGSGMMPKHQPKERLYSLRFRETALLVGTELSFHDAVAMLNRFLHREDEKVIKNRTYQDFCQRSGQELTAYLAAKTQEILECAGFETGTNKPQAGDALAPEVKQGGTNFPETEAIRQAIGTFNASRTDNDEQIQQDTFALECPTETCYISIDDVGVKHQKEHRKENTPKQGVYVWNTVAVIQSQMHSYTLTGGNMPQVFRSVLAYLLSHQILENTNLVFFTDGASDIRCNIEQTFDFHPYTIILDWYHLKKRCQEYLSMSIKGGKEKRNAILQKLLRILWAGNITQAVQYLKSLPQKHLRLVNRIPDLCTYFEKHRAHIPCYALRHLLGLRNSSNRVEKANDLVVVQRQKHNGMSWSTTGSIALAQIKALFLNHEISRWLHSRTLPLFLPAASMDYSNRSGRNILKILFIMKEYCLFMGNMVK